MVGDVVYLLVSLRVDATNRVLWRKNHDLGLMSTPGSQTGCNPIPEVLGRQFGSGNVACVLIESVIQLESGFPRFHSTIILGIPTTPNMHLEPCCVDNERSHTAKTAWVILDF